MRPSAQLMWLVFAGGVVVAATPAVPTPVLDNGIYYIKSYSRTQCGSFLAADTCNNGTTASLAQVPQAPGLLSCTFLTSCLVARH